MLLNAVLIPIGISFFLSPIGDAHKMLRAVTRLEASRQGSNPGEETRFLNITDLGELINKTGTVIDYIGKTIPNHKLEDNVDFFLFTQNTRNEPVKTQISDTELFGGKIDTSKPVKILIHGYWSGKDNNFAKTVREAYLNKGDYNVINVDWSKDSHNIIYNGARNDVPGMGKLVAKFIDRLVKEANLKVEVLHVLGHSLGAHIAGVAGSHIKSGLLRRITGLDPAGPLFSYNDEDRLKPSSARFVDVIHTCGKGLGFFGELGHVDFYPNGGTVGQPGCSTSLGKCSHQRAIQLFAESLTTPEGFLGRKCYDWKDFTGGKCQDNPTALMGEEVPFDTFGKFFLRTGESSPYNLGLKGASP